jgi:hypothetical protein
MTTTITDENINQINNTSLMQEYIKALIQNIEQSQIPKNLNLIFDGGVFNCGFAAGVALYIKELSNKNIIKINQISGCSAGALIALWYICGCNVSILNYLEKSMQTFKQNLSFGHIHTTIYDIVNELFPENNNENGENGENGEPSSSQQIRHTLNNKLFINYYDTRKNKQKVVSNFKNKAHLIKCLMRTIHIPYIIDGHPRCNKWYIDGIIPYVFKNSSDSLLIKLITFKKCSKAFILKSEKNIHYRLLSGVADANDFFTNGRSDMCIYISKRSYLDILLFRGRETMSVFLFTLIEYLIILKNYIPLSIRQSLIYNGIMNSIYGFLYDIAECIIV